MPPSPLPDLTTVNQEATAITGAATRSGHHLGEKQPMPPPTSSSSPAASPHRPAKERPKQTDRTRESTAGEINPSEEDKPPRAYDATLPSPEESALPAPSPEKEQQKLGKHPRAAVPQLPENMPSARSTESKQRRQKYLTDGQLKLASSKTPTPDPTWRSSSHEDNAAIVAWSPDEPVDLLSICKPKLLH